MRAVTPSHCPVGLMLKEIKLLPPECFKGKHDSESVKKIIAALETYFHLVGLKKIKLGHYLPRCI